MKLPPSEFVPLLNAADTFSPDLFNALPEKVQGNKLGIDLRTLQLFAAAARIDDIHICLPNHRNSPPYTHYLSPIYESKLQVHINTEEMTTRAWPYTPQTISEELNRQFTDAYREAAWIRKTGMSRRKALSVKTIERSVKSLENHCSF